MSKARDILILEANPGALRLFHARVGASPVVFHEACTYLSNERRDDRTVLDDQNILDQVSQRVSERGWTGKDLICILSGSAVSCHYFDMPPLKGAALRQAVLLKLKEHLHFEVDEAIVDIQTVLPPSEDNHNQQRVAVTAIRKESSHSALDAAARLGSNVLILTAAPSALSALACETTDLVPAGRRCSPGEVGSPSESGLPDEAGSPEETGSLDASGLRAYLHLDEQQSTLIVLNGTAPCVTSELPVGMRDFSAALMRPIIAGDDVIQLDEKQATALRDAVGIPEPDQSIDAYKISGKHLTPLLEPTLQKLTKHLTQWMMFVATSGENKKVSRMSLVGPGASLPGLDRIIGQRMKLDVDGVEWLKGRATLAASSKGFSPESLAVVTGAAEHWHTLPNLIPPEVHQQRKLRRICRSTSLAGPIVAAAIFGIAFLFDQMGMKIQPAVGAQQARLSHLQQLTGSNDQWIVLRESARRLQGEFDEFARVTPQWEGLFKELSLLLPSELMAVRFQALTESDGLQLMIESLVYTTPQGRSYDEVVEQTLRSLERSPFFRRVELLQSSVADEDGDVAAGS
ncbi:MAG: hypothetical protein ACE5EQ_12435, partial [Phycisphaerae bacterium]